MGDSRSKNMEEARNYPNLWGNPDSWECWHIKSQQEAGLERGLHGDADQLLPGLKEEKVWEMEMSLWRRQPTCKTAGLQLVGWAENIIPGRGKSMEVGE